MFNLKKVIIKHFKYIQPNVVSLSMSLIYNSLLRLFAVNKIIFNTWLIYWYNLSQ